MRPPLVLLSTAMPLTFDERRPIRMFTNELCPVRVRLDPGPQRERPVPRKAIGICPSMVPFYWRWTPASWSLRPVCLTGWAVSIRGPAELIIRSGREVSVTTRRLKTVKPAMFERAITIMLSKPPRPREFRMSVIPRVASLINEIRLPPGSSVAMSVGTRFWPAR